MSLTIKLSTIGVRGGRLGDYGACTAMKVGAASAAGLTPRSPLLLSCWVVGLGRRSQSLGLTLDCLLPFKPQLLGKA